MSWIGWPFAKQTFPRDIAEIAGADALDAYEQSHVAIEWVAT